MSLAHDAIPETALAWVSAGKKAALATVIETWGSAPRQPGALLAISEAGELAGSVSGGCVEGAVAVEAIEAMEDGTCRMLEYGVSDEDAFAVGLACGGTIRIRVEPVGIGEGLPLATLRALVEAREGRARTVLASDFATGERRLLALCDGDALTEMARRAADADRSGYAEVDGQNWFLAVHNPPLRMAIIGAAHIAQPLTIMARLTGFDVTVIDPRESFSSETRFPDTALSRDWPDVALAAHGVDARTAIVCLSHDPKLDDPALGLALRSEAFYIGALGSKKTTAKRAERLREAGFEAAAIARIDAPIGLPIGSKSPAEIAVSVMARIIEALRKPETR